MKKSSKAWAKYPVQIESNYYRDIKPIITRLRKLCREIIEPELSRWAKFKYFSMDDSVTEKIGQVFHRFRVNLYGVDYPMGGDPKTLAFRTLIEYQVDKSAGAMQKFHKNRFVANQKFVIGVNPLESEPWIKPFLRDFTMRNVALIKDIPEFAISDMEKLITESVMKGESTTRLRWIIQDKLGIAEKRAKLIARDQANKMYGTLTELRSRYNGWDFYEWDTVEDEAVRPDHKRLQGKIYAFNDPPVTVTSGKRAGEKNNPGQDIQCFPAGTMISTLDGEKPIETIRIGDSVHSHGGVKEVVELHKNHFSGELTGLQFFNKTVWVTPNHKIFVKGRGWIRADQLKVGDKLVKLEEVFPTGCFSEKAVRDIEHPHPHLLNQNIVTVGIDSRHGPLNLKNSVKAVQVKISDIINTIDPVWFFKLPMWDVFNMQHIKPSSAVDFRPWNNTSLAISGLDPLRSRKACCSSFRVINPLSCNRFAAVSNSDSIAFKCFSNSPIVKAGQFLDLPIRHFLNFIGIAKPIAKGLIESFFKLFDSSIKRSVITAGFGAKLFSSVLKRTRKALKGFATRKTYNFDSFRTSHNTSNEGEKNNPTKHLHCTISGIIRKKFEGDVYNFGVDDSMSYFAEGILVANCRCVAMIIFDRQTILQLKKQPDGSYAIPKQLAA